MPIQTYMPSGKWRRQYLGLWGHYGCRDMRFTYLFVIRPIWWTTYNISLIRPIHNNSWKVDKHNNQIHFLEVVYDVIWYIRAVNCIVRCVILYICTEKVMKKMNNMQYYTISILISTKYKFTFHYNTTKKKVSMLNSVHNSKPALPHILISKYTGIATFWCTDIRIYQTVDLRPQSTISI